MKKSILKETTYWTAGGILLCVIFLGLGWSLGRQQQDNYNPYLILKGYSQSRHGFIVKSAEVSIEMSDRAIVALKKKHVKEAIEDCKTAIDIFPIDAKPYILLTKLYLMIGQEQNMFDVLTMAGNSYPNFDNIVSVIDDDDLDKLPLQEPQDNVYLATFPENKKMAMSFMFDDGEANVYKALPTFEKYGYRATIPVVAGFVSENINDPFWGSWAQWKDAANRGFEIANHSMYHRDSKNLHGRDFDVSIDQAKATIEKNVGYPVTAYVFPHDSYTDEAMQRALKTHEAIRVPEFLRSYYDRTEEIVIGGPHVSVQTAERLVDIGIKRRLWLIAKCHGVTVKRSMRSFKSITPQFLDDYLNYIHSKSDDVWVDTFSHVFEYMSARAHTTIDIKSSGPNFVDFVLRNNNTQAKPMPPVTVVVKSQGMKSLSAQGADGHQLKAWVCAEGRLCVDVDAYNQNVHLHWGL